MKNDNKPIWTHNNFENTKVMT